MTYRLLDPPQPVKALGCWASNVGAFTHVAGYSGLGHFFLTDIETGEHAVLYPFKRAWKSYGTFESTAEFADEILEDPGFAMYVLDPDRQRRLADRLGPLGEYQVYIPAPYPFMGGDESNLESYEVGNVWVFADLVGQFHGF